MGWMAAAVIGSSLLSADAAGNAAEAQIQGSRESTAAQERMFNKQVELQAPWREAGVNALGRLTRGDILNEDPGYAFRLSEGQKALDRSAAARGGLISGAALKAATRFGQDYGSQEYTNAFNRYANIAGLGQTATNNMSNAAGNFGAAEGANAINAGNARASGYVGGANAMNQGLGTYLNYTQNQNMMNMLAQNRYGTNYGQFTPGSDAFVGPMQG